MERCLFSQLNMYFSKKLLQEIKTINNRISEKHSYSSQKEEKLLKLAKLTEELGELSQEVLSSVGYQRLDKLKNHSQEALELEFADVIITSLLLAETCDIDVNNALKNKLKKLEMRYQDDDKS